MFLRGQRHLSRQVHQIIQKRAIIEETKEKKKQKRKVEWRRKDKQNREEGNQNSNELKAERRKKKKKVLSWPAEALQWCSYRLGALG